MKLEADVGQLKEDSMPAQLCEKRGKSAESVFHILLFIFLLFAEIGDAKGTKSKVKATSNGLQIEF